jgi:hypothetical protein
MAEKTAAALEVLDQIRSAAPTQRFLRSWNRESRVLWFGCGDTERGVLVSSSGELQKAETARPTKLQNRTVREFLAGRTVEGPIEAIRKILTDYIYFADPRLFDLFAVWIVGTYVYSIFSHYGYLFLHSETPRCGKTRAEEIASHLAFEATSPRNAPTPPTMRETADRS